MRCGSPKEDENYDYISTYLPFTETVSWFPHRFFPRFPLLSSRMKLFHESRLFPVHGSPEHFLRHGSWRTFILPTSTWTAPPSTVNRDRFGRRDPIGVVAWFILGPIEGQMRFLLAIPCTIDNATQHLRITASSRASPRPSQPRHRFRAPPHGSYPPQERTGQIPHGYVHLQRTSLCPWPGILPRVLQGPGECNMALLNRL